MYYKLNHTVFNATDINAHKYYKLVDPILILCICG